MTVTDLANTAIQYKKEIKIMPYIALADTLKHMTPEPGIQFQKVLPNLTGAFELSNHDGAKNLQTGPTLGKRTLTTYVGDVLIEEKPEDLRSVIQGNALLGNNGNLDKHPLELQILALVAKNISKKLAVAIFQGERNGATLNSTNAVFDGFDHITSDEITATNISAGNGNYEEVDPITSSNALDILMSAWEGSEDELKAVPTKLFIPFATYHAYNRDFASTYGANPYNVQYKKTFLEGTDGLCELVPMTGKAGSSYMHLTTKENCRVGFDMMSDAESMIVRPCDNPWKVQFAMKMNFGVQFETLDKTCFKVFKFV